MRTTLNVDDDLLQRLREEAARSGTSLRVTLNRMLRLGLERLQAENPRFPYRCPTFSMGSPPLSNLDQALQLASQLEDEGVQHKLLSHK